MREIQLHHAQLGRDRVTGRIYAKSFTVVGKTFVDDVDYGVFNTYRWFLGADGYAFRKDGKEYVRLHREILGLCRRQLELRNNLVDHVNHDRLDNQRNNLRVVTNQQNHFNQRIRRGNKASKYKGVSAAVSPPGWRAYIRQNQKQKHLGYFKSETAAAQAYNVAAEQIFGEYACLNMI